MMIRNLQSSCVFALILCVGAVAQENIKAKHEAYYRCINNIETKPVEAYVFCTEYLRLYPNDDPRLVEFASMFTTAYRKIDTYLRSVSANDFIDGPSWSVYKPDLERTIPWANEPNDKFKIVIQRKYDSPDEDKLLAKAEAVYPSRKSISNQFFREWRYFSQPSVTLTPDEPKWWGGTGDSILTAELPTTSAVLYYVNTSLQLRARNGKLRENSFVFLTSDLKYEAKISRFEKYERSGKTFANVYVAEINLTWSEVCGGLCGRGSTRNKVVILRPGGEILAVFLDDPVNSSSWIS